MTGGSVSYNIRPNKHVERVLFFELLKLICPEHPENYVYISMGGPQLADQLSAHFDLGFNNLISIESDELVFKRQLFNVRPSCIKCEQLTSQQLVDNFDEIELNYPDKNFIVWLDYASPKNRLEQLTEFSTLVGSLNHGDVVKITLNANPNTLGGSIRNSESRTDFYKRRLNNLKSKLGPFATNDLSQENITSGGFVTALCKAVDKAAKYGIEKRTNVSKIPVSIFTYKDSEHTMLTYTIKIVRTNTLEEERKKIDGVWDYFPHNEIEFSDINVPHLTVKERLHIESLFYSKDIEGIHKDLPFQLSPEESESIQSLNQYFLHYRRYPGFLNVKV